MTIMILTQNGKLSINFRLIEIQLQLVMYRLTGHAFQDHKIKKLRSRSLAIKLPRPVKSWRVTKPEPRGRLCQSFWLKIILVKLVCISKISRERSAARGGKTTAQRRRKQRGRQGEREREREKWTARRGYSVRSTMALQRSQLVADCRACLWLFGETSVSTVAFSIAASSFDLPHRLAATLSGTINSGKHGNRISGKLA